MGGDADITSGETADSRAASKPGSPIAELTRTVRNFFAELLDLKYQFTYDELNHELYNHNLDWKFRAQIDKFFKRLTEMEFSGREVTEQEVGAAALEAKSIIKRLSGYVQERPKSRSADWGKEGVFSKLKRVTGLDIGSQRKRGELPSEEDAEAEREEPVGQMPDQLHEKAEQPRHEEAQDEHTKGTKAEHAPTEVREPEGPADSEPPSPPPYKAGHEKAEGGAKSRALGRLGRLSKRIGRRPVIISRRPKGPGEPSAGPSKPHEPMKPVRHGMTAGESGPNSAPTVEAILSNLDAFAGRRIRLVGSLKFINRIIEKTDFWYMFEDTTGKIVAVSKDTDKYEGRGTLRGVVKKTLTGEAFIEIERFN